MSDVPKIIGRAHRLGDDVNTDVILAGRYQALREPAELAAHGLEDFGSGSSRGDGVEIRRHAAFVQP